MGLQDELDRWNIRKGLRPKIYLGGLAMVLTYSIILSGEYWRCRNSKDDMSERWREEMRTDFEDRLKEMDRRLNPQIEKLETSVQQSARKLDSLKNTTP